ncbi:MAG: N-6 DNA methylase [Rhodocyclaceae bacterium]|nr:N-6 DNA methylase [Rhodocyclaceae bacterium]
MNWFLSVVVPRGCSARRCRHRHHGPHSTWTWLRRSPRLPAITHWRHVSPNVASPATCRRTPRSAAGASATHVPVRVTDALAADPGERFDVVLTNPPFGKKSSTVIVGEDGKTTTEKDIVERDDFWATTSNKQLNFVQHIKTLLAIPGRAAVVVPDNVLFEGGAGEIIRRKLLHECEVHTLMRLPTGLFYAQGVKANVIFFDKKPASETPWTRKLWIYDLRTNMHFTSKTNPMRVEEPARRGLQ